MNFCIPPLRWLALVALVFLTQCADDPADDAATAEVVTEDEADAAAMELADSLDFGFADDEAEGEAADDSAVVEESRIFVFGDDSKIGFIGSKLTAVHEGSFKNFSGLFTVLGDTIDVDGMHRISIDLSSVVTDDDKLTEHLKSEDFFDVAKFPVATFTLLDMSLKDESDTDYDVSGVLNLHGVRKKITFPAAIAVNEDRNSVQMQAKFSIDRKVFGIVYPGMSDDLIRDRVVIDLDLHAVPGEPTPLELTGAEKPSQPIVLSAETIPGIPPATDAAAAAPEGGGGRRPGGGGGRGGTPAEAIARLDGNGDGKLTEDEVPEFIWGRMSAADANGDGAVDEEELNMARQVREAAGDGGGGKGGDGGGKGSGGKGGGVPGL